MASDGIATDFQIHARIAVLGGMISPVDNRRILPLKYKNVEFRDKWWYSFVGAGEGRVGCG